MSLVPPIIAVLLACQVTLTAVDVEPAPAVVENAAAAVQPPPPAVPRTEIPQTWLAPGYLWVPGHYDWAGKDYAWKEGAWQPVKMPAGAQLAWFEGRWVKDPSGADQWNWVPAHFEPIDPNVVFAAQDAQAQARPAAEPGGGTEVVVEQSGPVYYDSTVIIGPPIWWGPAYSPYYGGGYYRGGYYGGAYFGGGWYGNGYYRGGVYNGGGPYRGSAYGGGAPYRGGTYHGSPPAPHENRSQR